jgi:hypothetical protein
MVRIPWNKGKKGVQACSDETRKKMSATRKGKPQPHVSKMLAERNRKMAKDPAFCKRNSERIKKKYEDPEYVANVKEGRKRRSNNPIWREKIITRNKTTQLEKLLGGFWYGNVRYPDVPKYCEKFNREFKERVRAFWNYQCFECGSPQNGIKHAVHHVHYDKKMCCNGSPQDVVPLCDYCHGRTQANREYWEDHFTDLLYANDPNGKCFFTKEEYESFIK